MRKVLAISGKRYSGKDALATALVSAARARGITIATHAFAGESKRMFVAAQASRGVTVELARLVGDDRAYKEQWRPALTAFTVAAMASDPLVFCRAVADRIAASEDPAVITDLRLRREVDHLRPRFAVHVVRVQRADASRAASGWRYDAAKDDHHTETELDDPSQWSETIANDGTLAELGEKAAALMIWLEPDSIVRG